MDPGTASLIAAAISASGSVAGGILGNSGPPAETKMQKMTRKLVDDLLQSLKGGGSYSHLFNADEETFNKSFRDPAMSRFSNVIAPGIQQQYLASGQQRNTGLDDQLLRAGIDMNQLLNQDYGNWQEAAKGRSMSVLQSALGMGAGAPNQMSSGQAAMQGLGGYISSPAFSDMVAQGFKPYTNPQNENKTQKISRGGGRSGFEMPQDQWGTAP
jgi:hypothetical protein